MTDRENSSEERQGVTNNLVSESRRPFSRATLTLGSTDEDESGKDRADKERIRREVLTERHRIITALEEERGTKVITLIHRKEPWIREGEPGYITIEDTEHLLREIKRTPKDKPIDVILHTPGGLVLAAEMIATALHEHKAKVAVFIPFYAMSGGTLVALTADEIYMEKFSVMGPVDPQIDGCPLQLTGSFSKRRSWTP